MDVPTSDPEPQKRAHTAHFGEQRGILDEPHARGCLSRECHQLVGDFLVGRHLRGGVRLVGVRAGSPAEKAGLRGDDVITKIGSMEVPDLQAMTDALRSHKPGDIVEIVIRRGAQLTTVRATLGTRGG